MDTYTYPGKGLSLAQLVFALNEKLRLTEHPSCFTLDAVSQLERDISTALRTIREWKNTFAPINRVPLDILSLISTHLHLQKDRFSATFVCRHWRRVFLEHAALWSQLSTGKGEDYVTTLLERAKGSPLDIVLDRNSPSNIITLLPPHARQFKHLTFSGNLWSQISAFSQVISGPLPLLRTLKISVRPSYGLNSQYNEFPPLLFSGAVNLEEFDFEPWSTGSLKNFLFQNLTTFKLSTAPMVDFNASDLFNFLKASPMLQTVEVVFGCEVVLESDPGELVVLPNVKTFSLSVDGTVQQVYEPAARISCPHATSTLLEQRIFDDHLSHGMEIFPNPVSCKAIVHQYSTSSAEEVTLKIGGHEFMTDVTYSLTFKSSDAAVIRFGLQLGKSGEDHEDLPMSLERMDLEIFTQGCRTIQSHPLLSHIKRLHIKGESTYFSGTHMVYMLWELLGSMGPLDELAFHGFDLEELLPEFGSAGRVCPPVKKLTISEEWMFDEERCADVLVRFAQLQHELEKPFERVTIYARDFPAVVAERLRQWVGAVDYY